MWLFFMLFGNQAGLFSLASTLAAPARAGAAAPASSPPAELA